MSFETIVGDLFTHPAEAIGHGVNCRGVAGAGVAAVMAKKFPLSIEMYKRACREGLSPGGALLTGGDGRWIVHCASQDRPGPDARPDWLRTSLEEALDLLLEEGVESLALPLIGGGIGGLDPDEAFAIIRDVAESSPIHVTLVTLPT